MKILVTGANGQLGREIVGLRTAVQAYEKDVVGADREEMDVTDLDAVRRMVGRVRPDAIIHAAAYTAVDKAESDPDAAFLVNAIGTRNVAIAAEECGCKVCYISTDYVFDGRGAAPYGEYDNTAPESVYGKTKRAGETLVESLSSRWFVVRTSWVFGVHGANFVKTMLAKGQEGATLRVVEDQIGSPTYTKDLATFLLDLVATDKYGVYHATNAGTCSWYEFAKAIFEDAGMTVDLSPCSTSEFPRPAPRPAYSVLGNTALRMNGFKPLPHWRDALQEYLKEVNR